MIIQQPLLTFHYKLLISDLVHLLITATHFAATLVTVDFSHLMSAKTGELGLACLVDDCLLLLCQILMGAKRNIGLSKWSNCHYIIVLWAVFDLLILFHRLDTRLTRRLLILFCLESDSFLFQCLFWRLDELACILLRIFLNFWLSWSVGRWSNCLSLGLLSVKEAQLVFYCEFATLSHIIFAFKCIDRELFHGNFNIIGTYYQN